MVVGARWRSFSPASGGLAPSLDPGHSPGTVGMGKVVVGAYGAGLAHLKEVSHGEVLAHIKADLGAEGVELSAIGCTRSKAASHGHVERFEMGHIDSDPQP